MQWKSVNIIVYKKIYNTEISFFHARKKCDKQYILKEHQTPTVRCFGSTVQRNRYQVEFWQNNRAVEVFL